jgi:hypothetical protein
MELAVPVAAVEQQSALLRRQGTGLVDRQQILRQDNAPFQLLPARIPACRQIDRAAAFPESLPVRLGGIPRLVEGWQFAGDLARRERADQFQSLGAAGRRQHEPMGFGRGQGGTGGPGQRDPVAVVVELPRQVGAVVAARRHHRAVRLRFGPVGTFRHPAFAAGLAVGECKGHREPAGGHQRRFDPDGNRIAVRRGAGDDLDRLSLDRVAAGQRTAPKIELLPDFLEIGRNQSGAIGLLHRQRQ